MPLSRTVAHVLPANCELIVWVATRRYPSRSSIANWLIRVPVTTPLACQPTAVPSMSNRSIRVFEE